VVNDDGRFGEVIDLGLGRVTMVLDMAPRRISRDMEPRPMAGRPVATATAVELVGIPGPTGRFFSDGTHLFSSANPGLQIWDPTYGARVATVRGFTPTHHHRRSGEFLQLDAGTVRTWTRP
jgi:hypothetical protein